MITVAIIEEDREFANSLREIIELQDDMTCNSLFFSPEDAMISLPKDEVDVLVLDASFLNPSEVPILSFLKEKNCIKEFCIYTSIQDCEIIFDFLRLGVNGYVLKQADHSNLLQAIRDLNNIGSYMSPVISRLVLDKYIRGVNSLNSNVSLNQNSDFFHLLTNREYLILSNLSEGLLYKEIAFKLGISTGTVKQHVHRIYKKLNVSNRTEAIIKLNRSFEK